MWPEHRRRTGGGQKLVFVVWLALAVRCLLHAQQRRLGHLVLAEAALGLRLACARIRRRPWLATLLHHNDPEWGARQSTVANTGAANILNCGARPRRMQSALSPMAPARGLFAASWIPYG